MSDSRQDRTATLYGGVAAVSGWFCADVVQVNEKGKDQERWMTPPEVWEPLHAEFSFELDAAADAQTARLPRYLTDALDIEWPAQRIWLNPPYGRKLEPFVRKAADEAAKGKLVVALIPFRCRAAWWHECVIGKAAEVRCVRKRVGFLRPDGSRGDFTGSCDSCIVIWDGYVGRGKYTRMTGWEQAA